VIVECCCDGIETLLGRAVLNAVSSTIERLSEVKVR
jgi:hypothetical protein